MTTKGRAFRCLTNLLFLLTVGLTSPLTQGADSMEGTAPSPPSLATVHATYGQLPLSFEANHGQWEAPVQFVTRGHGHTLYVTPNQAVLSVRIGGETDQGRASDAAQHTPVSETAPISHSVVRMNFAGADQKAEVMGLEPLPGIVNYFIGADPAKWRTNIPTYQKIGYKDVYPGIDLVYYGNQGRLEYDFIVAPGADPAQIRVVFEGAEQLTVDATGDLVLTLPHASTVADQKETATLRLHKPVVYQRDAQGEKHLLAGTYVVEPSTDHAASVVGPSRPTPQVAFQVAAYDRSRPLIIDPVLSWVTYLGGNAFEVGSALAVDAAGNAYVTGSTGSPNFPGTASSAIQSTYGGGDIDAFVTKLNAAGTAIVYSTYLGGSRNGNEDLGARNSDAGLGIAVDTAGNAYVTGVTNSSDFPGTAGSAIQSALVESTSDGSPDVFARDGFVTKLNTTGTALLYSTYLGGHGSDGGNEIVVDAVGNAYVIGTTNSTDFPGTAGSAIQSVLGGALDGFVTKLNAAGTAILYSTYLGGGINDECFGIAVDAVGNAYVTGYTVSSNFPGTASSAIQSTNGGFEDVFVAKLNAAGTAIVYSTYLGGGSLDRGNGIAVDAAGNAYVTGSTGSPNFPGTSGSAIQSTFGSNIVGTEDAFVTKLNAAGTALAYSTYLGGRGNDGGTGIAVDTSGKAYVTGATNSTNFPVTAGSAIQDTLGGVVDVFVAKVNAAGTALLYSTYLGGTDSNADNSSGTGIAVDAVGNAYVTGWTTAANFPGTVGSAIQRTFGGEGDVFVAKITDGASSIPFAAFDPRAKIEVRDQEFKMKATFTLGPGNNGIAPLTEPVVIQMGTFLTTLPAGSFKSHKGRFKFEGDINGVQLEVELRSLILGNDYEVKVEGQGVDVTGITNPVTVSLTIGNDSGSKAITAKMK